MTTSTNPPDLILSLIKDNPGIREDQIQFRIAYNEELISDCVLALKLQRQITNVGSKLYSLKDFPNIAPDTSLILKEIKNHPNTGISYEGLSDKIGFPREIIREELRFLKNQKLIREEDSLFYPVFIPDPVSKHSLLDSLDFLTREELIALVRLLCQQHKWMDESLSLAERLAKSRRTYIPKEKPEPLKTDSPINLKF